MGRHFNNHIKSLNASIDVLGKWVWCGNEKTAQTSIAQILTHRCVARKRGTRNWERVWRQVILPHIDEVFMFTFVRNPWDRVVSIVFGLKEKGVLLPELQFQDYVKQVLIKENVKVEGLFREQLPTFSYRNQRITQMFIGRFESLQKDWAKIAKILGVTEELPHINKSEHDHYTEYYDDECKEIVRKLYQREIEVLGYEFGN